MAVENLNQLNFEFWIILQVGFGRADAYMPFFSEYSRIFLDCRDNHHHNPFVIYFFFFEFEVNAGKRFLVK